MDSIVEYGLAIHPLIPGRKEPSDRSEMVTQILFGELYTVLEKREKWIFIQNQDDDYTCWIDVKQHQDLSINDFDILNDSEYDIVAEPLAEMVNHSNLKIPFGSKVNYRKAILTAMKQPVCAGKIAEPKFSHVEVYANLFLEAPYLWGGKSILGIDCSGFCQVIFAACGVKIPRDAYQQAEMGRTIEFIDEGKTGDLAFFDNKDGKITHVGILIKSDEIIHASGKVRIDKIDHQGIYNQELKEYTHKLRIIKRLNL